jgi:predicted amidohydrolase YtcJ
MVVLSADYFSILDEEIEDFESVITIVDGKGFFMASKKIDKYSPYWAARN